MKEKIMEKEKELTFLEKLTKVQQELEAPKGQYNEFGHYNYRSCEDILSAVKPSLEKYKLFLNITDALVMIGERYYVRAVARIRECGTLSEWVESTSYAREEVKKGMDGSQITGASSSYARKYALNGLFLIDDTKDSDTTNTGGKKVNKKVSDPRITKVASQKQKDYIKELHQKIFGEALKEDITLFNSEQASVRINSLLAEAKKQPQRDTRTENDKKIEKELDKAEEK